MILSICKTDAFVLALIYKAQFQSRSHKEFTDKGSLLLTYNSSFHGFGPAAHLNSTLINPVQPLHTAVCSNTLSSMRDSPDFQCKREHLEVEEICSQEESCRYKYSQVICAKTVWCVQTKTKAILLSRMLLSSSLYNSELHYEAWLNNMSCSLH